MTVHCRILVKKDYWIGSQLRRILTLSLLTTLSGSRLSLALDRSLSPLPYQFMVRTFSCRSVPVF